MLWMLFVGLFLVCVGMAMVFCLYLCILWFATIRHPAPPAPGAPQGEKAGWGLTETELQGLPGAGDGEMVRGTECTVCLDDILDGQPARILPACRHAFHRPCVDEWLIANPACPLCRTVLLPTSPSPPLVSAAV